MPAVLVETPSSKLEAQLVLNPEGRLADVGLLLVHPYSLLGGSMHDGVVTELFRQAMEGGQFGAVLRYNQRGVGLSSGSRLSLRNLRGQEDAADVLELVDFLVGRLEGQRKRVVVVGYSWGSCLATYALDHPSLAAYIGISFPLGGISAVLQTRVRFDALCRASQVPRLLVLGDCDQYTKREALNEAMQAGGGVVLQEDSSFEPAAVAGAAAEGAGRGQALQLKVFAGNDHFWSSDCALMAEFTLAYVELVVTK